MTGDVVDVDRQPIPPAALPDLPPLETARLATEPVTFAGTLAGIPAAVYPVLVAFNIWSPSDAQIGALGGLYTALLAVTFSWARSKAYAPATVARLLAAETARR